jgi:1-deoxy-D-xylulose-5-phosphate synthase
MLRRFESVVTVEDNAMAGGFGSAVLELAATRGVRGRNIIPVGIPDSFIEHGTIPELKKKCGLDEDSLYRKFKEVFS